LLKIVSSLIFDSVIIAERKISVVNQTPKVKGMESLDGLFGAEIMAA
jgi:hypothetical protein